MMWQMFDALYCLVMAVVGCMLFALLVYGIGCGVMTFCKLCVRTLDRIAKPE